MIEAIFLGLVQGLTEFLPISSSAHLRIIGVFLPSAQDPGAAFTAVIQIGTEIAVLLYFRRDISFIITSWFASLRSKIARDGKSESMGKEFHDAARMGWYVGLGSLPILILGYLGQDYIKTTFRSLWIIALTLIIFGLLLGFLDRKSSHDKSLNELNPRDGILYGLAQSLALIPGVSRSGATIAMGRALSYDRAVALRFSFLLAIPAVLASGIYELKDAFTIPNQPFTLIETGAATLVSFVVGYSVIKWLMGFVSRQSFMPFVIYRVILGTGLLVALATGFISA